MGHSECHSLASEQQCTLQPDILSMNAVMTVTDQEIVLFITTNHHMLFNVRSRNPGSFEYTSMKIYGSPSSTEDAHSCLLTVQFIRLQLMSTCRKTLKNGCTTPQFKKTFVTIKHYLLLSKNVQVQKTPKKSDLWE